ncbi:MAG: DUF3887 domain-containing protein [Christensenella sp.]|nr:DUF3887 domain-containing protein [Christensenella sp.]
MKQNYRRIVVALLALALSVGLFACAGKPLPAGFDADEVGTSAEEVVGLATMGDYDSVVSLLRSDLQGTITADQLKEGWAPIYEKAGAFDSITKTTFSGTKDSTTGEEYAVAQVLVKHENASLLYTLSFDQDLALVGLYLK